MAELFATFSDGRVPVERWQQALEVLPPISTSSAAGPTGDIDNSTNAGPVTPAQRGSEDVEMDEANGSRKEDEGQGTATLAESALERPNSQEFVTSDHRGQSPSSPRPARSLSASPITQRHVGVPIRRAQSLTMGEAQSVTKPSSPPAATAPRPTTGGKSIEYLAKLGLAPMPRVTLTLKRSREAIHGNAQDEEYLDLGESEGDHEVEEDGMDAMTTTMNLLLTPNAPRKRNAEWSQRLSSMTAMMKPLAGAKDLGLNAGNLTTGQHSRPRNPAQLVSLQVEGVTPSFFTQRAGEVKNKDDPAQPATSARQPADSTN